MPVWLHKFGSGRGWPMRSCNSDRVVSRMHGLLVHRCRPDVPDSVDCVRWEASFARSA